ncbi:MAG: hypothetical protein ACOCQD_01940 [archaeon]
MILNVLDYEWIYLSRRNYTNCRVCNAYLKGPIKILRAKIITNHDIRPIVEFYCDEECFRNMNKPRDTFGCMKKF